MKLLLASVSLPALPSTVLRSPPRQQQPPSTEGDPVSLSEEGLATAKTKNEIWALHARIHGPADAQRFTKTLRYLDGIYKLSGVETKFDENPFWGMGRDELAAIEMDEAGYTKEERYAAFRAKGALDNMFFTRLAEYTTSTHDHRPMEKGYLEYLDNLTPVERLNYPDNERAAVAARLAAAEREMGSLPADFSLWKYINWDPKGRLNLEAMLDPANGGPVPTSEVSAIAQASGQTKGVGETDTTEKIRLDR